MRFFRERLCMEKWFEDWVLDYCNILRSGRGRVYIGDRIKVMNEVEGKLGEYGFLEVKEGVII